MNTRHDKSGVAIARLCKRLGDGPTVDEHEGFAQMADTSPEVKVPMLISTYAPAQPVATHLSPRIGLKVRPKIFFIDPREIIANCPH